MSNYEIIERIINEWDPVGLFPMAPMDEYESEIKRIFDYIDSTETVRIDCLSEKIKTVFEKAFGDDVFFKDIEECKKVANKIVEEIEISV